MLELPESATISKQINQTLKGKTITRVQVNASPHKFAFFYEDPNQYSSLLVGKTVNQAVQFGGYVVLHLASVHAAFGDGVQIRYYEAIDPIPSKHQLLIEFNDQSKLVCSVQMYGAMFVFEVGTMQNPYYKIAQEKPSPLSKEFDLDYFKALVETSSLKLSIKAFLATQQRIPGLGNGILQDILFHARLHPKTKLAQLTSKQIEQLFDAVKQVSEQMTEMGGRDTEKDLYGKFGGYQTILSSKTISKPCPNCQEKILKEAYLGGSIYYCPHCQPLTEKN